jgi:leucyl-tRNA synthetase
MQTNWIGRSEGRRRRFPHRAGRRRWSIFTTRPDTLWGATFMVLAPEHPLVMQDRSPPPSSRPRSRVQVQAARMDEIERGAADKEKTGVFTGGYAINPVNGERIPIWIADYVLMTYGTGAIMAVPAHDERDFAFAQQVRPGDSPGRRAPDPMAHRRDADEPYDSKEYGRDDQLGRVRRHARRQRRKNPAIAGVTGSQRRRARAPSTTACATG